MTVDLDLLADYVEGLLEPDERARVISLVQYDPEWASAHDALVAALPSVAAALASVTPEPMPASVLTASLQSFAAERAAHATAAERAAHATAAERAAHATTAERAAHATTAERAAHATATEPNRTAANAHKRDDTRPRVGRPPTSSTKRARRRELRGALLGAFALVLMVAIGLGYLVHNDTQSVKGAAATDGRAAAPQLTGSGTANGGAPVIVASGRDYTQVTLPTAYGAQNSLSVTSPVRTPHSIVPGPENGSAALGRLRSPAALNACLAGVTGAIGGTPTLVDYAQFQGVPALIVTTTAPKAVIAVGADCGLPDRGIDELARS